MSHTQLTRRSNGWAASRGRRFSRLLRRPKVTVRAKTSFDRRFDVNDLTLIRNLNPATAWLWPKKGGTQTMHRMSVPAEVGPKQDVVDAQAG